MDPLRHEHGFYIHGKRSQTPGSERRVPSRCWTIGPVTRARRPHKADDALEETAAALRHPHTAPTSPSRSRSTSGLAAGPRPSTEQASPARAPLVRNRCRHLGRSAASARQSCNIRPCPELSQSAKMPVATIRLPDLSPLQQPASNMPIAKPNQEDLLPLLRHSPKMPRTRPNMHELPVPAPMLNLLDLSALLRPSRNTRMSMLNPLHRPPLLQA
mmetsp:Transcript_94494/g.303944  ORF Transcript_94494/g.303944 Transcript_94494/m.303944 type:complete len:215 (+) Transcript_94494:1-645(+)